MHKYFSCARSVDLSDSETMPMHLGDVLEPLIGVWGVVWRRVGLSGKRRGDVFAYLSGFLKYFFGFLAVSRRVGCGLEASWKRCQSILEESWGIHREVFPVLKTILLSRPHVLTTL